MEWSEVKSKQIKALSAAIGASAMVAMGALTVALSSDSDTTSVLSEPEVTLGETSTSSTAPEEPETTLAEPEVTAEPPTGFATSTP